MMRYRENARILGWLEITIGIGLMLMGASVFWIGTIDLAFWPILSGLGCMIAGGLVFDEGRLKL